MALTLTTSTDAGARRSVRVSLPGTKMNNGTTDWALVSGASSGIGAAIARVRSRVGMAWC